MTNPLAHTSEGRPGNVVALVYEGLCIFEFGIVAEVFGLPRPEIDGDWYRFKSVALEKGPLRAAGGLEITVTGSEADLEQAGTIIIPGWRGKDESVPATLCKALRRAHKRGARLVSICSGAYVLAAAGLLDGRRVTTHWRYVEDFSDKYPGVFVEPDSLYIEDGNILSSAGSSAGIDLCLYIVRRDFGTKIANSVARRLVMHAHRQGGQTQFIEQPVPVENEAHRLSATLDYIRSNLDRTHSVVSLAAVSGMSSRTFQRRFVALTGTPVGQWITRERLTRACTLLETTQAPLDDIVDIVGLANVGNLRYHFRKDFGISPGQYRKRFGRQTVEAS
ncbi:MAG: transcriptional regulator FtrA [Fimbriimonadaceae bacterium]|nr:transcriptional regulator FtrA [Alphaproteobacteria bacterium]